MEIWQAVLKQQRIGIHDNYFELGGDSILSIQIVARARQAGIDFDLKQLFGAQTIAALAQTAKAARRISAEQGLVSGHLPCTAIQHYFFTEIKHDAHHFNQSVLLEVAPGINANVLQMALTRLIDHHDVLRLQVVQKDPVQLEIGKHLDLYGIFLISHFKQPQEITEQARALQASMELINAPLLRVMLFQDTEQSINDRLLLVMHHLLVDGVSWRLLLEDLEQLYRQIQNNQHPGLPQKTTSYVEWATRLDSFARSDALKDDIVYWQCYCQYEFGQLPVDKVVGQTISLNDTTTLQLELDQEVTSALMQTPVRLQSSVETVLLAALLDTVWLWTGKQNLSIELEGHGRNSLFDDLDVSRTVGWFTTLYPLALLASHDTALDAVSTALRELPRQGLSYGLLRYQSDHSELQQQLKSAEHRNSAIRFNYLGRFEAARSDSLFIGQAAQHRGEERAISQVFSQLLDINCAIHQDIFTLEVRYSPLQFNKQTIQQRLDDFKQQLLLALEPLINPDKPQFTMPGLNDQRLKNIVSRGVIEDIFPLAPLQQGLLFHSVFSEQSTSYLQQVSWHFHGNLDLECWCQSWEQLIEMHPVLRTGFDWQGVQQPLQVVFKHTELIWQDIDYSHDQDSSPEVLIQHYLQQDKKIQFDSKDMPLQRFACLRINPRHTVFVWSYHHLLLDGWSLPKLIEDIFSLYAAKITGKSAKLPQRRPFRDYIDWVLKRDITEALNFWRKQLNGFHSPNKLVIDSGQEPDPAQQIDYQQLTIILDQSATTELVRFAHQQRVTLNVVLQAVWTVLLSRYSSSRDILFGATVSGRPVDLEQVGDMLGLFINTIPVRINLNAKLNWGQLLQSLMQGSLERESHCHVQLAELQRLTEVQADQRLFDTLFIFENYPLYESVEQQSSELQVRHFQVDEQTDLPLTLLITPGKQLSLTISYQQHHFHQHQIQELLKHFQILARQMMTAPDSRLINASLLESVEQQHLLSSNDNAVDHDCLPAITLHELVSRQTRCSPDNVAVQFDRQQLSYAQLEQQADQLAIQLQARGIGCESIVAICMPRCPEMLVSLLAVLKTGAAYLPLDLNLPVRRLQFMVDDSDAQLVLTNGPLELQLSVPIEDASVLLQHQANPQSLTQSRVLPHNLAYVIYTSGSTGKPKAVQISHHNIVNFMLTMSKAPGIDTDDRLLAVTTLAFDIAALELFLPLTTGATVVLADAQQSADGYALQTLLQEHDITMMQATPASWRLLLASGWQGHSQFKALCGGEALPPSLAEQLQERAGQVWNVYGPTETTVWSSRYLLKKSGQVLLGEGLANTRLYVVDEQLNLVPDGFPGELMIAGDGVARGYQNRCGLTAERFIPDPFAEDGSRMYRTGDQVRRYADGSVDYLGRLDFQAKIRGYRIELGEIEACMEALSEVDQAVVVIDQSRQDHQQLMVYYRGQEQTPQALRDHLSGHLPGYMIPSEFIHVEQFALTHSGKVDRKRLPKPQVNTHRQDIAKARTQTQKQLLVIWQQVLQRDSISIDDNFFDLGGHSLLLMQVWNVLEEHDLNVQTVDLFRYPTIAKLAAYLDSSQSHRHQASVHRATLKAQRQRSSRRRKIKTRQ
ncbi:MAG: amino acid adenylation domain-containing protein [Gammaproteobacteria bacterium]|nr:amino acid adenylation domain-containing protein [Gammaproteobacteria bacterium]